MKALTKILLFSLLISSILLGCASSQSDREITLKETPTEALASTETIVSIAPPMGSDGYPWWNDTVFYEVFVRNFYDQDKDAIGDFEGLIEKLDYLKTLGITGIYLMPIHPSGDASIDASGYRVEDYLAVNSDFGTMDDFRSLVSEIHKRGMRVIIDLVINHTSNLHPWFKAAQDPNSPYRDYYIWSDSFPSTKGPWGQDAWFEGENGYYFATFGEYFPDLNYQNPSVTDEIYEIARFWLVEIGVDGFRLDAAQHLIEEDPQNQVNTESSHQWYENFREYIKNLKPNTLIAGEVWNVDPVVLASYTQGDELDLVWEFGIQQAIINSIESGDRNQIAQVLEESIDTIPDFQFITFLSNHDMTRIMTALENDVEKAKTAAFILLTIPGVPFIYFGEEIGMQGGGEIEYESLLIPMQWTNEDNSPSWKEAWETVSQDYLDYNVEEEISDPNSILTFYRELISLRNLHPAIRVGNFSIIDSRNPAFFSFLRVSQQEKLIVIVNLANRSITGIELSMNESVLPEGYYSISSLIGGDLIADLTIDVNGGFSLTLSSIEVPPYAKYILILSEN